MSTFEVPAQSRSLTLKEVEQKTQYLYEKSVEENKEYWRQRLKKQRREQFPAVLTELEEVADFKEHIKTAISEKTSERQLGGSVKYGADGIPFDFAMPNVVPVGAVFNTAADAAPIIKKL